MALYAPSVALTLCKRWIKGMPIDSDTTTAAQMLDVVNSTIWNAAQWSWSTAWMNNVSVVGGTQDYVVGSGPTTTFLYLTQAMLSDGNTTNYLKCVPVLPTTEIQVGTPSQVAYLSSSGTARVYPKPTASLAQTLSLAYKLTPTKITSSNYATAGTLIMPDAYFPVFQAGALYYALQFADDQRAGAARCDQDGKTEYTGQLGTFMAMLNDMKRIEKLPLEWPGNVVSHG